MESVRQISGLGSFYRISDGSKIDLLSGDDPADDLGRDVIYTNIGAAEWQSVLAR
jgi:hypothetical protein